MIVGRFPHGSETVVHLPGVVSADCGGHCHRSAAVPHQQRGRVTAHSGDLLLLHASAHHPGRWIFHAQPAVF